MIKKIKKIFKNNTVAWVKNTQREYKHLESENYLLVNSYDEGVMLFTPDQVKAAKRRAKNNPEDIK